MFSIGDKVVYGTGGVMEVVDIKKEEVLGTVQEYYVLWTPGTSADYKTYVPVANKKLVSSMRPLISREEAMRLIREVDALPEMKWQKDSRSRTEAFRQVVESGDHEKMISMIKAIYKAGKQRSEEGKKNYLSDDNAMHKAERLLYSEFSAVLDIPVGEVPDFIASQCEK